MERNTIKRKRKRQSGVTLMELMVVLIIIGLIGGIAAVNVMSSLEKAKTKTAAGACEAIIKAAGHYKMDHKKYPESIEQLRNPPGGGESYLDTYSKDPWDNEYFIKPMGSKIQVISYGADGVQGGEGENEDIVRPKEEE